MVKLLEIQEQTLHHAYASNYSEFALYMLERLLEIRPADLSAEETREINEIAGDWCRQEKLDD